MYEASLNYSAMPNPLAPEVWMPYQGNLYQVYTAVAMGVLAVIILRYYSHLSSDTDARLSVYFPVAVHNTLLTQEADNCRDWASVLSVFFASIHIPAGFLFLLRVRAVYNDLPRFKFFISAIWAAYTGGCLLTFFGIRGTRVVPLRRCIGVFMKPYPAIMFFAQAGYDLFLCAAVTYKIACDLSVERRELKQLWSFRLRNNPFIKLRARFLSDSHAFFLLTSLLKITEIVVYFRGTPAVLLISSLCDNILISLQLFAKR
ncbi:hypothetical protein CPB83DRAFT_941373 [Crepidotus variabilis]|uniref:Uncharacterized protein n=1 Tax=Crepidotus variabilis TaxID=179855 RepID=A0A9P6JLZ8_9AGAR|nr:hypothetical protein CPB83DRAFT_941373 [Crepidotus variabilis]